MAASQPTIERLRNELISTQSTLVELIRTAKVIARKLGLHEFEAWLNLEIGGYTNIDRDKIPKYRHLRGQLVAYNPIRGLIPILFEPGDKVEEIASIVVIADPIGKVVDDSRASGVLTVSVATRLRDHLHAHMGNIGSLRFPISVKLDHNQIAGIADAVRDHLLEWCLELEESGVRGDAMSYPESEKKSAQSVTNNFFRSNVGVVGSIEGNARVHLLQHWNNLDIPETRRVIRQIRDVQASLPPTIVEQLESPLMQAEAELQCDEPDKSRVGELLQTIKTIAEGAAGNLVASGVVAVLKPLLGL